MAKCDGWHPRDDTAHPPGCIPGECRKCWRKCKTKIRETVRRCQTCTWALVEHPAPSVRLSVAEEDDLPLDAARFLAKDPDAPVAHAARRRLDEAVPQIGSGDGPPPGMPRWSALDDEGW